MRCSPPHAVRLTPRARMNFIASLGPSCCQLATLRSAVQFAPSSSVSAWLTARLAACPNLVGHFRVAQLAGVSSVIRLIGKSPNPRRIEPRYVRTGILSFRRVAATEMIASTWASRISFEVGGHQTPASNPKANQKRLRLSFAA